jgi:UDP:flavonoid glycosyltransferase YjiC (YdhE family)
MSLNVLLVSTSGTGHVHPLVPIGQELLARGHHVRWVTNSPGLERVRSYGFDAVAGGPTLGERMPKFAAATGDLSSVARDQLRPLAFSTMFGTLAAPVMRTALVPVVDEFCPDVIVHEFSELASAAVARARDIPHVSVAFSGEPYTAILRATAPTMQAVWAAEGLDVPADLGFFDHLYLHPWPASMGQRPDAPTVLDSWHMGFDGRAPDSDTPAWLQALGRDRPLVYVSFGTEMGPMAPWPALLQAMSDLSADVVVTTGPGIDLEAHGRIPPNVRVEAYVPQSFVLDRASVAVSHSGAGAVAATLERGIPHVCIPLGADQWDNADAVAAAGVGAVLHRNARTPDSIAGAVASLLVDGAVASRCDAVRAEVERMPQVSEAVDAIVDLATP